jgi:hypothetical protein
MASSRKLPTSYNISILTEYEGGGDYEATSGGDISTALAAWVADTDNNLRIRTHLEFVEAKLRKVNTENVSLTARRNRAELLDRLHDYWTANKFPSPSIQYEGRKPCFIDSDGTICAVGHLIEMASGRPVAEYINTKYQYEYLLEMNDPLIDNWASEHGFSLEELAQIQPTYDWERPINPIAPGIYIWDTPIAVTTNSTTYQGPSKKELALQAELDTLRPMHDSIVRALDSTMNLFAAKKETGLPHFPWRQAYQ